MKASDALTKPGDAARRESDGAVAVWMYEFGSDPVKIKVMAPHVQSWWTPGQDIPGDDWQPLHPAGELEAQNLWLREQYSKVIDQFTHSLSKPTYPAELVIEHMQTYFRERVDEDIAEAFEEFGGIEEVRKVADHADKLAAEVKRLTAERDEARRERDSFREKRDAARAKGRLAAAQAVERDRAIDALTARVAELESGSAFVGDEYHPQEWEIYWEEFRGKLRLAEFGSGSLSEQCERIRYRYTGPTTAPLPTAGEEAKAGACGGCGGSGIDYVSDDPPAAMPCPECFPSPTNFNCGDNVYINGDARRWTVDAVYPGAGGYLSIRSDDCEVKQVDPADVVLARDARPAPAEPDSPAEERPKYATTHYTQLPAEATRDVFTMLRSLKAGEVVTFHFEGKGTYLDVHCSANHLHCGISEVACALEDAYVKAWARHYRPTDAAAEALRSEIEGGGAR